MLALSALTALTGGALNVKLVSDLPGFGKAGETIQMTLSPQDVSIAEEMDSLIVGFKPIGMRADEVCPVHLVDADIGNYREFGLNNAFRLVNVLSSIQADIPEVDIDTSLKSYQLQERALGGFIPTVTQLHANLGTVNWDIKASTLKRIEAGLALDREVRVWTLLTDPNSWLAGNRATVAGGAEWNDPENGDPIRDIMDRIEASAQAITRIWMQPPVAHAMLRNKNTLLYIKSIGGDSNAISRDIVDAATSAPNQNVDFQIPGLPPISVCASKVLNETSGALDYILNDSVVLVSQPAGAENTGEDIMTCKTFRRKGPSGTGYTTREINLERRGLHGGVFMASGHAENVKMISGAVGGLIQDTLQA
jgi:hypothetical protein